MANERVLRSTDIPRSGELISDRLIIEGGRPLEGKVRLQGAKNLALQAITCAILLTDGKLILENVPRIADVENTLAILRKLGANIEWQDQNVLSCDCSSLKPREIDPEESLKTTGSRYFIPVLARRYGLVVTGPSGGDRLGNGDRDDFSEETLDSYAQMGLGHSDYKGRDGIKRHAFLSSPNLPVGSIRQEERYFSNTVQALLFHANGIQGHEFIIRNPCIEPEIFETIRLLNSMGAAIYYEGQGSDQGEDFIYITSMASLAGTRFRIMSDPNVLVSYAVMAMITDGHVVIENIDYSSKVDAFLQILSGMNADFCYNANQRSLELSPSMSRLKQVDLETNFWPAECHTDWQQILTPLLAKLDGESYIDENVHPARFTTFAPLLKMGAKLELKTEPNRLKRKSFKAERPAKPHTLKITGPCEFASYSTRGPADIRGTIALLAAMLSSSGVSILDGASQIQRGMEDVVSNLQSLGANVSVG